MLPASPSCLARPRYRGGAACCRQEARLLRYDLATGKALTSIATEQNEPFRLAVSHDGQRLLTGAYLNGRAHLWDTASGQSAGPALEHGQ